MPKASPARARLPRGTKPVIQAFFDALEAIPDASRAEVAKAAHAGIRDALKAEREEAKQERARERTAGTLTRKPGKAKAAAARGRGKAATRAPKRSSKTGAGPAQRRARAAARPRDNEDVEGTQEDAEQNGEE